MVQLPLYVKRHATNGNACQQITNDKTEKVNIYLIKIKRDASLTKQNLNAVLIE